MAQLFVNNAQTTLAVAKAAGATTMTVVAGSGARFPAPTGGDYFLITLYKIVDGLEATYEIVKCTARSIDTLTIVGAQEGTTATSFAIGDQVSLRATAGWMNRFSNVNNTSDADKPVSTAMQAALDTKVQNGTGVGQVTTSTVKIGFTGSTLNRIKATVDTTDFGNLVTENAPYTFTQLQMFSGHAGASSSTFDPATTDWVKAALYTLGAKGGGIAVIDTANSAGGCIWAEGAALRFGTGTFSSGTPPVLDIQQGFVTPSTDNATSFGSFNRRWTNIYAATGTVQTSSAAHKTPVMPLYAAEISAAQQLATEIGKFKFLDAVDEKGNAARDHIGLTVQRAIAVMQWHGLSPFNYGFICYDAWPEKIINHAEVLDDLLDENGDVVHDENGAAVRVVVRAAYTETQEAGEIYSFRPDELSLFIARGQAARIDALEARLASLGV